MRSCMRFCACTIVQRWRLRMPFAACLEPDTKGPIKGDARLMHMTAPTEQAAPHQGCCTALGVSSPHVLECLQNSAE
jgi:hypothetical protein